MTVATFVKAGLKEVLAEVDTVNPLELEKAADWQAGIFSVTQGFCDS